MIRWVCIHCQYTETRTTDALFCPKCGHRQQPVQSCASPEAKPDTPTSNSALDSEVGAETSASCGPCDENDEVSKSEYDDYKGADSILGSSAITCTALDKSKPQTESAMESDVMALAGSEESQLECSRLDVALPYDIVVSHKEHENIANVLEPLCGKDDKKSQSRVVEPESEVDKMSHGNSVKEVTCGHHVSIEETTATGNGGRIGEESVQVSALPEQGAASDVVDLSASMPVSMQRVC